MSFRLLTCRLAAVADARKAVMAGEIPHANFALRQSLVDLASCAQEMANELPAPTAHIQGRTRRPRRH